MRHVTATMESHDLWLEHAHSEKREQQRRNLMLFNLNLGPTSSLNDKLIRTHIAHSSQYFFKTASTHSDPHQSTTRTLLHANASFGEGNGRPHAV